MEKSVPKERRKYQEGDYAELCKTIMEPSSEPRPRQRVYLLHCNDAVLDVYATRGAAARAAEKFMQRTPHALWKQVRNFRWTQENGSIARLEVEEREVLNG